MGNPSREQLATAVFRRLARDPGFRVHFSAVAPDGSRPIVVGLPTDPLRRILAELVAVGGSATLVVPYLNGFFIVSMSPGDGTEECSPVDPECTVGVFVQRLIMDEPPTEYSVGGGRSKSDGSRAALVALAEG